MQEQIDVQTGFADINGGKLYYEVAGNGPVLILAHAGIADRRMWDYQFLVFAQHYRVLRFDFWGHGQSTIDHETFFLHEDLRQLCKVLSIECAHFLGCSLGGRVSIDLTLAYPEMVNSLIVVGSGLGGYQFEGAALMHLAEQIMAAREQEDDEQEIELFLQYWIDGQARTLDQVNPQVRERARQMLRGRSRKLGEGQPLEPGAIGRLSEIKVPTLIIVGDRDDADIATIADLLASNIDGAQQVSIPNTAHLANMEKPEQFNQIVLGFLQSTKA
jgi:pimeloyl-ACP methyl ester carboxylesterase